jgi:hypothetical protein
MQDDMQEGLTEEEIQGGDGGVVGIMKTKSEEPMQPTRMSIRIAGQPNTLNMVEDGVRNQNHDGSIPGTNLNSLNSFVVLDDEDICARALEMGVNLILLIWKKIII